VISCVPRYHGTKGTPPWCRMPIADHDRMELGHGAVGEWRIHASAHRLRDAKVMRCVEYNYQDTGNSGYEGADAEAYAVQRQVIILMRRSMNSSSITTPKCICKAYTATIAL
jgi:hypothetical protein